MYAALLHTHSLLRFIVLLLLIGVVVNSFLGMTSKKPFGKLDNLLGLSLFSVTHTQLLVGLALYFSSSFVVFSSDTMKDASLRYWTVEHITLMLVAIALITVARITAKKMTDDAARHKRMFVFNALALVIILMAIAMSQRGFFAITGTPGT
jgi:membrane-associated HD superfamily phosphohydrolase